MEKYLMLGAQLLGTCFVAAAIVVIAACVLAILRGMYTDFKNRLCVIRVLRRALKPISQELENGQD